MRNSFIAKLKCLEKNRNDGEGYKIKAKSDEGILLEIAVFSKYGNSVSQKQLKLNFICLIIEGMVGIGALGEHRFIILLRINFSLYGGWIYSFMLMFVSRHCFFL